MQTGGVDGCASIRGDRGEQAQRIGVEHSLTGCRLDAQYTDRLATRLNRDSQIGEGLAPHPGRADLPAVFFHILVDQKRLTLFYNLAG